MAQRRHRWLVAAAEITAVLLGRVNRSAALALIAKRAREVAGAELALVLLHDEDTDLLTIEVADAAADQSPPLLVGTRMATAETQFAEAVHARRHVVVEHLGKAAPWPTPPSDRSATVVPLATADSLHGLLVMVDAAGERRDRDEDLAMLTAFAGQAALAFERALSQEEREMYVILEDRERIARDLHDVVIQRLFATGLQLQTVARLAKGPDVAERVNEAVDELDTTIRDIRSAIFELRSPMNAELRADIRELVHAASLSLGFRPTLEMVGPLDSATSTAVRADVLAVLREALSNVARHAGATTVSIAIRVEAGRLTITVTDDGVGISEGVARSGLANMRERAANHGGSFDVRPGPPQGTVVEWSVPV